jgi:hypothetical protein
MALGSYLLSAAPSLTFSERSEIYVDDTNLIVTRPNLTTAAAVHEELERSASAWAAGLNATGGALNPEKMQMDTRGLLLQGRQIEVRRATRPRHQDTLT